MLLYVDQKEVQRHKCIRKKVPNAGEAPEIHLNARDKFCITTFYTNVDESETEMRRRKKDVQKNPRKFPF